MAGFRALRGRSHASRGYHVDRCRAFAARSAPAATSTRSSARDRRRRRHRRLACATNPGSPVRSPPIGTVLPRLHPVGAADRSAAGDGGRGHHRRPARHQRPALGHRLVRAQRLPRLDQHGRATRRTQAGSEPSCARFGPRRTLRGATGAAAGRRGGPSAARRRARRGSSPGSSTPSTTTRSGRRFAASRRWIAHEIPVLLLGGWQDLFLEQTLAQYQRLRERGVPVAVTIGPWNHTQLMTKAAPRSCANRWAGWTRTWQSNARWRAQRRCASTSTARRLEGPGRLAARDARARAAISARRRLGRPVRTRTRMRPRRRSPIDPADPTPTIGGRLSVAGGRLPQRHAGWPSARDVLTLHRSTRCRRTSMSSEAPIVRTVALVRQALQRPVRRVSEVDVRGPVPQRERRISPVCDTSLRAPCALSWMRSRTGSAPDHASGCWSPVDRIRGSPATSAPESR